MKSEICVPCLGGLAHILVTYADAWVCVAIVIGGARIEGRVSRESWLAIVSGAGL